jgi:hypothetical protein
MTGAARLARRFRWSDSFAAVDAHDFDNTVWVFALRRQQIAGLGEEEALSLIRARSAAA